MSGLIYKGSSPLKSSIHIPFRSNFWMFLMVRYQDYTIILDDFFFTTSLQADWNDASDSGNHSPHTKKNILTLW